MSCTKEGQNDNDEVIDIPGPAEVVPAETDDLYDCLHGKDGGKHYVYDV